MRVPFIFSGRLIIIILSALAINSPVTIMADSVKRDIKGITVGVPVDEAIGIAKSDGLQCVPLPTDSCLMCAVNARSDSNVIELLTNNTFVVAIYPTTFIYPSLVYKVMLLFSSRGNITDVMRNIASQFRIVGVDINDKMIGFKYAPDNDNEDGFRFEARQSTSGYTVSIFDNNIIRKEGEASKHPIKSIPNFNR
jgi:hypothetical protein